MGTRNQHALIDDERQTAEPGLPEQIGGRYALLDAPLQQILQVRTLIVLEAAVEVAVGHFPGQVQRTQHQLARLVPGVVGAVPEEQLFGLETADGPANVVAQGAQTGRRSGHGSISCQKRGSLAEGPQSYLCFWCLCADRAFDIENHKD